MINLDNDFGRFYTLAPCRLFDSREIEDGPALSSSVTRIVTTHGTCGIPSNAAAIAVTATVAHASAAGRLKLHSGDDMAPLASTVSFGPAQTRSGNALLLLRSNGNGTLSILPVMDAMARCT